VKRQFIGCSFDDTDDLLTAVQEIPDGFDKPMLIRILEECVGGRRNISREKRSTLGERNSASGFIRLGLVNAETLIGARDTLYFASRDLF
jgi:hypothetical protein